jgi:hypothetical protein
LTSQRSLQIGLQERYRTLAKSEYRYFGEKAAYLRNYVLEHAALAAIVHSLDDLAPEVDPAEWVATRSVDRQGIDLPPTEAGQAKLLWYLLGCWAEETREVKQDDRWVSFETQFQDITRAACEQLVEPLVGYLQERLGDDSDVLRLIGRYKRRVEWFDRKRLHAEFLENQTQGEAVYDRDLRRYLFDQGIDNPFSQPRSASGEADVIALLETEDPLVLEIKLYDGEGRGIANIASGVQQAARYASDYHKTTAYVAIFNLTDRHLVLPTDDETASWPPSVRVGDVKVNLIVIQALPLPSASTQGRVQQVTVTRAQLLTEEAGNS